MQYFNKPKQVNIQDVFIRLSHFRLTPYIHRGVRSDDSIFLGIQPIECFENNICGLLWQHACCQQLRCGDFDVAGAEGQFALYIARRRY